MHNAFELNDSQQTTETSSLFCTHDSMKEEWPSVISPDSYTSRTSNIIHEKIEGTVHFIPGLKLK